MLCTKSHLPPLEGANTSQHHEPSSQILHDTRTKFTNTSRTKVTQIRTELYCYIYSRQHLGHAAAHVSSISSPPRICHRGVSVTAVAPDAPIQFLAPTYSLLYTHRVAITPLSAPLRGVYKPRTPAPFRYCTLLVNRSATAFFVPR